MLEHTVSTCKTNDCTLTNPMNIFVGMSGGVDSSVAALLLKEEGHDVTGVFIQGWYPDWLECNWKEDRRDAMRVCSQLGIPFITINAEKEYKEHVVDYLVSEYRLGRTPNPDIMCNLHVKFGVFLEKALEMGADMVATGHYARNVEIDSRMYIAAGKDTNKDQSYFLWALEQEQLKHVLFPLGEYAKPKIRELAEKYDLITAKKRDSQGVCFLGSISMKDFLQEYLPSTPGEVRNVAGEVVGLHDGAWFVTVGQRHGFTITKKTPEDEPVYVVAKNVSTNVITVGTKLEQVTTVKKTKKLVLEDVVLSNVPEKEVVCRFRYRQELIPCHIRYNDEEYIVEFFQDQISVASGQSLVLYDGEICLGGGIIM